MIESFSATRNGVPVNLVYRLGESVPDGWYIEQDGVQFQLFTEVEDVTVDEVDQDRLRSLPSRIDALSQLASFEVPRVDQGGRLVPKDKHNDLPNLTANLRREIELFVPRVSEPPEGE